MTEPMSQQDWWLELLGSPGQVMPSLAPPSLTGATAEGMDASTLRFLAAARCTRGSLRRGEEEAGGGGAEEAVAHSLESAHFPPATGARELVGEGEGDGEGEGEGEAEVPGVQHLLVLLWDQKEEEEEEKKEDESFLFSSTSIPSSATSYVPAMFVTLLAVLSLPAS